MDGTDRQHRRSSTSRRRRPRRAVYSVTRSEAFSLVELLVVMAILAVLVAVLLPVLARTRASAMKVVCAGRLRELTLACLMYRDENRVLPQPLQQSTLDPLGQLVLGHAPQQVSTRLLNDLRPYLKFPEVNVSTRASQLPPFVQCPFAEEASDVDRGPAIALFETDVATFYTGYAYVGRLDEAPLPPSPPTGTLITFSMPRIDSGELLRPGRCAVAKDRRRAVLWADHVSRSKLAGGFWQYTHARGGRAGPLPLTRLDWRGLLGQHRAYTDASVEWVGAGESGLKVDDVQFDAHASFKTATEHWWF